MNFLFYGDFQNLSFTEAKLGFTSNAYDDEYADDQDRRDLGQEVSRQAQDRARMAKDMPKTTQDGARVAAESAKMAQDRPKKGPRQRQDGPRQA